jgi:hypothetical protein
MEEEMFPSSPCSSTVVLLKASYVVKAGAGISEQAYFLTDDQPLYGEGRGTKWATVEWVIISTLSMALMPKKADGIQFQDPHLTVLVKRIMCRFVDGTTIWQNLLLQQSTEYETVRLQPGTLTAKDTIYARRKSFLLTLLRLILLVMMQIGTYYGSCYKILDR